MITREMLIKKADEYDRKKKKYPEEFYCYHLDILKNANNINEFVRVVVRNLLLWKLGEKKGSTLLVKKVYLSMSCERLKYR